LTKRPLKVVNYPCIIIYVTFYTFNSLSINQSINQSIYVINVSIT